MSQQLLIIVGIALLALGTYSIRFAGFHLGAKFSFSEKYQVLLSNGATVLLCAIAVTTTFLNTNISQVSHVYLGWVWHFS